MDQDITTILLELSELLPNPLPIAVGVSGGPDSMFLMYMIKRYYDSRNRPHSLIHVIHFNHNQREVAYTEQTMVISQFPSMYRYRNMELPSKGLSETKLRDARHAFFATALAQEHISYLFLGHNLSDRIETSMLNAVRWCGILWRQWMSKQQKKWKTTYIRPLLWISKSQIQSYCDALSISYIIDPTNADTSNPRNTVRNNILPQIYLLHSWGKSSWEKSRQHFYAEQEKKLKQQIWVTHSPHHYWRAMCWVSSKRIDVSPQALYHLFRADTYITEKQVKQLYNNIQTHTTWWFHVWQRSIYCAYGTVHCIFGDKKFWEDIPTKSKKITHSWVLHFDRNIITIPEAWLWYTIRYPQPGDMYKKKPLSKAFIAQKIPQFLRTTTMVVADGNNIITILS
jgi:tRNA(Ile)-lysidine synthetase-like protein